MFARIVETTWSTLAEIYNEFSLETTIHGVKYTTQAKSTVERFLWILILTASLLVSGKLAYLFYERHQSASMSTSILSEQYPSPELALPAVTLCHGSLATVQKVVSYLTSQKRIYMPRGLTRDDFRSSLRYLREIIYPRDHFPEELDKLQQILTANRLSLLELLENVSPNCSEFLIMCRFEGTTVPCEKLTEPIATPYGMCCSFNYENSYENPRRSSGVTKPSRSAHFGGRFVLSFLARSYRSKERLSSILYGDGIKVMVHEKYSYPGPMAPHFNVAAGSETVVRFHGIRLISTEDILNLPPKVRGCASSSSSADLYRADNCYTECHDSIIRRFCQCVPFFASSMMNDEQVCDLTHVSCIARLTLQAQSLHENCDCLPDCEDTTYKVSITTVPFSGAQFGLGEFYETARQHPNATALHFTFASQSGILHRRELVLPKINLVSSLGGIFSLFLGCSFISVIEVVYFFCICFYCTLRQKLILRGTLRNH